jgi:GNAT superfamily N-acetyltransferase
VSIVIREADIEADRELLLASLSRHLAPLGEADHFDWRYRGNPEGRARSWVAIDRKRDTIVGIASAFPRRVYLSGCEERAWVLGDFYINPEYRSLGPALQLQRACLEAVDSREVAFCYDFPTATMMAVYKRLGINPFGQMLRLAKPLRVDRKVGEFAKHPAVVRWLSAAGNRLLALSDQRPRNRERLMISLQKGECGEEFSALAQAVGRRYAACVQRSAEYLNWRYLADTRCDHEVLTAHRDGMLLAYVVFATHGEDTTLVDLFGLEDHAVITSLVGSMVDLLRERGIVTVSAPVFESHPWLSLLQGLGFKTREASPVIVYGPPRSGANSSTWKGQTWFLMHGDRDL